MSPKIKNCYFKIVPHVMGFPHFHSIHYYELWHAVTSEPMNQIVIEDLTWKKHCKLNNRSLSKKENIQKCEFWLF